MIYCKCGPKESKRLKWHKWFAWFPVVIEEYSNGSKTKIWWQRIWRISKKHERDYEPYGFYYTNKYQINKPKEI